MKLRITAAILTFAAMLAGCQSSPGAISRKNPWCRASTVDLGPDSFFAALPTMDVQDAPMGDAIACWSKLSGVPVEVNWSALELSGVDRTTPITIHLQGRHADTALRDILDQAGGGFVQLDWIWKNDRLLIGTSEMFGAPEYLVIQTYSITDLLDDEKIDDAMVDDLVEMIIDLLDDGVWDGPPNPASIRVWGSRLVVRAKPRQHASIEQLLAALRHPIPAP